MSGEHFITTNSGARFYFDKPEEFRYELRDIGHALSNLCRFAGQGDWWSVAQHSLLVAELVEPRDKLRALLHDASEAFMVDVPGPLKQLPEMAGYKALEGRVMAEIHRQYSLSEDAEAERRVKYADMLACNAEARMLGLDSWARDYPLVEIPESIKDMNNGQAGKELARRVVEILGEANGRT